MDTEGNAHGLDLLATADGACVARGRRLTSLEGSGGGGRKEGKGEDGGGKEA